MSTPTPVRLQGILIPWRKQQTEARKTALDLLHSDRGGLIYQPPAGVFTGGAELDFTSMYPSLTVQFNISPETVTRPLEQAAAWEPFPGEPGLIPKTLAPLVSKRRRLKARARHLPAWDPRRTLWQRQANAQKWLPVTCFGYLGYKNARFGRIEAHEAVTAFGREAMLRAKEAAEALGCEVLHLYVDGLWVRHPTWGTIEEYRPLLEAVAARTGLTLEWEGLYRWLVFPPARTNPRLTVSNRYFGLLETPTGERELKVRGLECRRRDTPPWIRETQRRLLEALAQATRPEDLPTRFPACAAHLHRAWQALLRGEVPPTDLLITQRASRAPEDYRGTGPLPRAVRLLQRAGKPPQPGQAVAYWLIRHPPGIWPALLGPPSAPEDLDLDRYRLLLLRAAESVLGPLGVSPDDLALWLHHGYGHQSRWLTTGENLP